MADRQPATISVTDTTTTTGSTTSGMDAASAKAVGEATGQANAAADASGAAQVDTINATADLERKQSQAAYAKGVNDYFTGLAAVQAQDEIVRETTQRLDAAKDFKPDRTQLFDGDTGAVFGISAAIAAMAGGWLMGQGLTGGKNPYLDVVMKMIDDNARDQVDQHSNTVQELQRRLGSAEAAKKELKARMLGSVEETINAQARFEKSSIVQKGSAAVLAQVAAEKAKNSLDAAKLTAKTASESVQKSRQTRQMPNPAAMQGGGGSAISADGKPLDVNQGKLASRAEKAQKIADQLRAKRNSVKEAVGGMDRLGNWLADYTVGMNEKALEGENLISEMQNYNLERFQNSPGDKITSQKQNMGVPTRDSDIDAQIKFWEQQAASDRANAENAGVLFRERGDTTGGRRIPVVR
jgi:hypothetical protein